MNRRSYSSFGKGGAEYAVNHSPFGKGGAEYSEAGDLLNSRDIFYAPTAKLVVEIDGIQHYEADHQQWDETRDQYLKHIGLDVLRFNNLEVLNNREGVINIIEKKIQGKPINIEHGKLIKLW